MKRARRGRLNDDDLELWRRVTDRTEKLDLKTLFTREIDTPAPGEPPPRAPKVSIVGRPSGQQAQRGNDLQSSLPERMRAAPVQMDAKAFARMKRGKLRPEARIDLHGMTVDRAHPTLTGFILDQHRRGRRLVLVITGKGKMRDDGGPIPTRHGVLRHQVPQWLSLPPLSGIVLQVSPAHLSHGGGGAYYVYLRRQR